MAARTPVVGSADIRAEIARRYGLDRAGTGSAGSTRVPAAPAARFGGPMPKSAAAAVALPTPPLAVRVIGNMTYGVTSSMLTMFQGLGGNDTARLANFVEWQLDWSAIDDSAVESRLTAGGYTTLNKTLQQLWAQHVVADPPYEVRMRPAWEVQRAALVRAVYSQRQLQEIMVGFWHDHFNVTANDYAAGPVYAHYDRAVIRKYAFGNFRALLEAVAQSPAMLYYLDNVDNTRAGPNENYARELMELHTLGTEHYLGFMDPFAVPPAAEDASFPSGYTDIDVYETASAFTGWSLKNGHWQFPTENDGSFVYRSIWHDSGPKFLLGKLLYPEQPALKDGRDVLDRLASHPGTASHICSKLIRRLVDDVPQPTLVASAAAIFRANWRRANQIESTLRHILLSDEFRIAWGRKRRRPFETVAAALRATGTAWTPRVDNDASDTFNWLMGFTGHQPYDWPAPNGYPDTGAAWSGANSYAMTWRVLGWLVEAKDGSAPLMPILATSRAKVRPWTATKLVDYWCQRLLGYLPTATRRQMLIAFMAQNGDPVNGVIADTDSWSANDLKQHYNQQRLRSMVSMILMSPEFSSR